MGADFIDYTYLQKRGLIKKEEPKALSGAKINAQGFLELGSQAEQRETQTASPALSEASPLGFLDSLAQSAQNTTSIYGNEQAAEGSLELNAMKNKIEDLEFKLSNLMEKIENITLRLTEFERETR